MATSTTTTTQRFSFSINPSTFVAHPTVLPVAPAVQYFYISKEEIKALVKEAVMDMFAEITGVRPQP